MQADTQNQAAGIGRNLTVIDALLRQAQLRPWAPAYIDQEVTLSFRDLLTSARRGAAWMHGQGVRPGDTVAVPLDTHPASARMALELMYAIAYAGAVTLPLFPEVPGHARVELLERFGAQWLVANEAPASCGARALDPQRFDPADARLDKGAVPRADRPEAPFAYLFTSGTTSTAKVMLPTHEQFYGNVYAGSVGARVNHADRHLPPVPWPSNVGMRYLFRNHAVGAAVVAALIPETRTELGALLARFGVTRMSASPWQIRRLLQSPEPAVALPPLRDVLVVGAFISQAEIHAARAAISPNLAVIYGCNEVGLLATLRPGEDTSGGCVGTMPPDVEGCVDDGRGGRLVPGEIGELGFRTARMCTEYVGNPQATRERFRDGWFFPGDVGSIDAQGRVYLRGRSQEVINYGGLKIWPEDIEAVIKEHPAIGDAALAGLPDAQSGEKPVAFLVPRVSVTGQPEPAFFENELRKFCAARLDATRIPVLFVTVAEIPRNEAGKIRRDALITAYQQGRAALSAESSSIKPADSVLSVPQDAAQIATIVDSLAYYAASQPARPAYLDALGEVTYGQLYAAVRRTAAWLASQGVLAGHTVALPLDTTPSLAPRALEMFYAIAYLGATTLPLYPEVPLENRLSLIGRYAAHWLIAGGATQVAGARVLDPRGFDRNDALYDSLPAPRGDAPDTPVVHLFTSGTTGDPKVLLPTHAQLHGNVLSAAQAVGTDSHDRQLGAIPWPSGIGLRYLLRAHSVGAALVSVPVGDTREVLGATLRKFGVTRIYLSPWQLRRLLQSPAPAQSWPALRSIQVTGAFVSADEISQVRERLSPNMLVSYGCNELGSATVLWPDEAMPGPGCVGRLVPGMEMRVDDEQGDPLKAGGTGELGFRAPWMCTGYLANAPATSERFRGGWIYPGDIGSVDAKGYVYLRGRTQEVINYGGLKIWPEDVESVLKQHPDIFDAALAGLPDRQSGEKPVAFIVPRMPLSGPLGASLAEDALQRFCSAHIDSTRVPSLFVAVAQIPRNESGKIMRQALVAAYQQARTALTGQTG